MTTTLRCLMIVALASSWIGCVEYGNSAPPVVQRSDEKDPTTCPINGFKKMETGQDSSCLGGTQAEATTECAAKAVAGPTAAAIADAAAKCKASQKCGRGCPEDKPKCVGSTRAALVDPNPSSTTGRSPVCNAPTPWECTITWVFRCECVCE